MKRAPTEAMASVCDDDSAGDYDGEDGAVDDAEAVSDDNGDDRGAVGPS